MHIHGVHVLLFQRHHLPLLSLVLKFVGAGSLDRQSSALLVVLHGPVVEVEQLLSLLHHVLEESDCAHLEISLHLIDLLKGED